MQEYLKSLCFDPEQVVQTIKPLFILFIIPYLSTVFTSKTINSTKIPSNRHERKVRKWFILTYTYTVATVFIWFVVQYAFDKIIVNDLPRWTILTIYIIYFSLINKMNWDNFKNIRFHIEDGKSNLQKFLLIPFNFAIGLVIFFCSLGIIGEMYKWYIVMIIGYIGASIVLLLFLGIFIFGGIVPNKKTERINIYKLEIKDKVFENVLELIKKNKELEIKYQGEDGDIIIETIAVEGNVGIKRYYKANPTTSEAQTTPVNPTISGVETYSID